MHLAFEMPRQIEEERRARLDAGETQRSASRSYNVNQAMISRLAG